MSTETAHPAPWRPCLRGTRHMVVCGHPMAAQAGTGRARSRRQCDRRRRCTAGIALGVLEPEYVGFAGVAPILIRMGPNTGEVDHPERSRTLAQGPHRASTSTSTMPGRSRPAFKRLRRAGSRPDAWITALRALRHPQLRRGGVGRDSVRPRRIPRLPHPRPPDSRAPRRHTGRWPTTAAVFLPGRRSLPSVGDRFVQADLAGSLQYLADEERAKGGGEPDSRGCGRRAKPSTAATSRAPSLATTGRTAGLMTEEDLAGFRAGLEPPVRTRFRRPRHLRLRPVVPRPDAAPEPSTSSTVYESRGDGSQHPRLPARPRRSHQARGGRPRCVLRRSEVRPGADGRPAGQGLRGRTPER